MIVDSLISETDLALLSKFALDIPPRGTIVEIGAFVGSSTIHLAKSAKLRDGKVFAIDPFLQTYWPKEFIRSFLWSDVRTVFEQYLYNINIAGVWENIVTLKMESSEAGKLFKNHTVDLIFIDGNHHFRVVLADLELWWKKKKRTGTMIGHNFISSEAVNNAVEYFSSIQKLEIDSIGDDLFVLKENFCFAQT